MATFNQLAQIAVSPTFQSRVQYAMNAAAVAVYAETPPANHAARAAYATKVANGSFNLSAASYAVLTNSTIGAEAVLTTTPDNAIPDSDIQFAVNSIWNLLAGA